MSLLVTSPADDLDTSHSPTCQQQDADDHSHSRQNPQTMHSVGTAFSLQLRDVVVPSPDRDRRFGSFDQYTQRKTSSGGEAETYLHASPYKQLHGDIQKLKEALQVMRAEKDNEIAYLEEQLALLTTRETNRSIENESKASKVSDPPRLIPWMHSITEKGEIQTSRLGRHASFKTTKALAEIPSRQHSLLATAGTGSSSPTSLVLAERIAAAFLNPVLSLPYLHSIQFGADLVELSAQASALFETESRCLSLTSPAYVFGDLHGNLNDLNFFASHLWRFGFGLSAGTFLFLGDYVDRGASSLECVAYLFAHKILHPNKVFLLRGNHETRAVNGLEAYYGSGCFLTQCRERFGHDEGYIVWHQINHAFDRLPLAATIDDGVFCVHGGIPRPPVGAEVSHPLEAIRRLPVTAPMDVLNKRFYDANAQLTMVSDLLWGDPAREEHEPALDPSTGFGKSVRGGNAVCFGSKAIDDFLSATKCQFIVRAHEAAMDGVAVSKSAKVLTIFSTSKDHGLGDDATCGCVLVDRDRIAAINRSSGQPHTVRRRRSITSLQSPPDVLSSTQGRSSSGGSAAGGTGSIGSSTAASHAFADDRTSAASSSTHASGQSSTMAMGRVRRRSSHRDAYPSTSVPLVVATATAAAPSRRGGHDQDDCDSTDDEATPRARRAQAMVTGGSRRRQQGDDNNQSEDD